MIGNGTIQEMLDAIDEADEAQTAELVIASLRRLGEHGRNCAAIILDRAKADTDDDYLDEGLAQINAVEGVLDGRLDTL